MSTLSSNSKTIDTQRNGEWVAWRPLSLSAITPVQPILANRFFANKKIQKHV
jgi:hypothetical protein